jgi:hypothetical protein
MTESCSVGTPLVSDDRPCREAMLLQQLPHQLQRCPFIPLGLNQNVKHLAILINCTPVHCHVNEKWAEFAARP